MPVVGFLNGQWPDTFAHAAAAFREGLKETGFVDGQNVTIEYLRAEGQDDRLPAMASELVRRQVAVIAATGASAAADAAKAATSTIPILFIVGVDPVKLGLVASLARPDGNLTGVNFFAGELAAKRLELLRELTPDAARVAVLVDPASAAITETIVRDVETAARATGLSAWARQAGDLQLPRLYLHLRTQQSWAVPREEDHTARSHAGDAQGDQGGAATANASPNPGARGLDQAGGQRLLRLPCGANQRRCAKSILLLCEAHLAAHPASAQSEGSFLVAADAQPGRRLDSSTANPSSVS
jgi:hypothetical protein